VLVGLDSPIATLQVKRWADNYPDEALLAILPGVALTQLWELVGNVEAVLLVISILVFTASLLGLNAMLLASMRERRGEIEVLRSIGAPSAFIVGLLLLESLLIVTTGVVLAVFSLLLCIAVANDVLVQSFGLVLSAQIFSSSNMVFLFLIYLTTLLITVLPALQAYRVSKSVGAGSLET
jgi:putative ABC transport system permease protein